jgi:hypothetical protein
MQGDCIRGPMHTYDQLKWQQMTTNRYVRAYSAQHTRECCWAAGELWGPSPILIEEK